MKDLDNCIAAMVRLGHTHAPYYPWSFFLAVMAATGGMNVRR